MRTISLRSANADFTLALESEPDAGAETAIRDEVENLIMMTKSHDVGKSEDELLKIFIDADMAVLGKSWDAYKVYAAAIREEYRHVGDVDFCQKRKEFLENTLEGGGKVFATEEMIEGLEERARENMEREIDLLGIYLTESVVQ